MDLFGITESSVRATVRTEDDRYIIAERRSAAGPDGIPFPLSDSRRLVTVARILRTPLRAAVVVGRAVRVVLRAEVNGGWCPSRSSKPVRPFTGPGGFDSFRLRFGLTCGTLGERCKNTGEEEPGS